MVREQQDYPEVQVRSKYGATRIVINGYDTVFVDANKHSASNPEAGWTISGVRYGVSLHLQRDGATWTYAQKNRSSLYMSRAESTGSYSKDQGSFSARDKAFEEAVKIVKSIKLDLFEQAERVALNNLARRSEEKIEELEKVLAAHRETVADIDHKLAQR